MLLHLEDAEVRNLVSVDEATLVIEELFRQEAKGEVENRPTIELPLSRGFFRLKAGAAYALQSYGFKAYGSGRYTIFVYSTETNVLEGIVEAYGLTEIRTSAVSAVATKYMARPEAQTMGIIGTGREARAQVAAIAGVRSLRSVKAYSRSAERREAFAREMSEKLKLDVVPVASGEECVRDTDIVVTITNANTPVLAGAWLAEGAYVCAVGATTLFRRELDEDAIARAGTVVVEHLPQAQAECGELIYAAERSRLHWSRVRELKDIVAGSIPGRASPVEITLFDSIGVGAEDIALATYALRKARKSGVGQQLPL